jgi:hypothetical protein
MAMYVTRTRLEIQFQTNLRTRIRHIYHRNFKVQVMFYFLKIFFLNRFFGI